MIGLIREEYDGPTGIEDGGNQFDFWGDDAQAGGGVGLEELEDGRIDDCADM